MIIRPVMALGKASEEAVTAFAADSVIVAGVVSANFPIGTPVWTSETDYTETQYRGLVTVSGGTQITVECPATLAGAAPKLWKPTSKCLFSFDHSGPADDLGAVDYGFELRTSRGGTPYLTASRAVQEIVRLAFDNTLVADLAALRAFVVAATNGLDSFTLAWHDYGTGAVRCATVKLLTARIPTAMATPALAMIGPLEFVIVTENLYT